MTIESPEEYAYRVLNAFSRPISHLAAHREIFEALCFYQRSIQRQSSARAEAGQQNAALNDGKTP